MASLATKLAGKPPALQRSYLGGYPQNLAKSGQGEKYCQTLTDFDFLAAKIKHAEFGVRSLIEDFDFVDELNLPPQTAKALNLIQGALRLSAHILNRDKSQLASQLLGRMLDFDLPEIQTLLQQAKQWQGATLVATLDSASLTPPGGPLLRVLAGHSHWVTSSSSNPRWPKGYFWFKMTRP